MNIGFDLDGVFIATPPFVPDRVINFFYRKQHTKKLAYRLPSRLEQMVRIATHIAPLRPTIDENIRFVAKFAKKNKHKRYIISGRFSFLETMTKRLIKKNNFDDYFHETHFNFQNIQPHIFKHQQIKKHEIDIFVDDDLPLITYLSEKNPQVRFYWYNKTKAEQIQKNLFAITSLSAIFR